MIPAPGFGCEPGGSGWCAAGALGESWGVGCDGGAPSRGPSPDFGADDSRPGRVVSLGGDKCCAAAGLTGVVGVWLDGALTGADGVLLGPGPALAGAVVRGVSGELACGALESGVRVGGSGLGALLAGPSDGLCTPPPACGAIGMPPAMGVAGVVAAGSCGRASAVSPGARVGSCGWPLFVLVGSCAPGDSVPGVWAAG